MKVIQNPYEYPDFLHDSSNFKGECSKIYLPECNDDIIEAVELSKNMGEALTVSGGGTGLTGGRVPLGGAILNLSKINRPASFSEDNTLVTVDAGLPLYELLRAVEQKGMYFPPDPTEKSCHCGGIVSTNASGAKSFYYGAVRNFVDAISIVLPNGKPLKIKRGENKADGRIFSDFQGGALPSFSFIPLAAPEVKNASGYFLRENMDVIDLLIGSEGTLGVISEITFMLIARPEYIFSSLIHFSLEEQAIDFIYTARNGIGGHRPRAVEFFDSGALRLLKDDFPFAQPAFAAAVWLEMELRKEEADGAMEQLILLLQKFNAEDNVIVAADSAKRTELEKMRHAAAYKVNEYIAGKGLRKLGTDTAVPHNEFKEFYRFCKESVKKEGLDYVIYGHFGDSHIHLNMLPKDGREFEQGRQVYGEICKRAVELGGTVSAEHGIGKIKREYLKMMYGNEGIEQMKEIKRHFDPHFRLGRGNLFEPD